MQISDVILLQGHLNLNSSIEYCWETALHGSLTCLHVLWAKNWLPCFVLSFQGYLLSEHPWKIEIVSLFGAKGRVTFSLGRWCVTLEQWTDMLMPHPVYEIMFPHFIVPLLYCKPLHVQLLPGPLHAALWELGLGDQYKKMLKCWLVLFLWVIKIFVSNPGFSCLLPASMKLECSILVCESCKISDLHSSWQILGKSNSV